MSGELMAPRIDDPVREREYLRDGIGAIRAVIADGDLDAPVPACPGWTLRHLAWHLGEVQRWACGAILEGHPDTVTPPGPEAREQLLAWFDDGAGALLDVLARTDPGFGCWTFGPKPRTARFWFRRQAHEHAVHAVDAHSSQGLVRPVPVDLALDGVDEVVTMFFPRQVRLGRAAPLTRSLALRPTEAGDGGWVLAGDGQGRPDPDAADAVITGPAEALYLLLWRRIGADDPRLHRTGDGLAADSVLGAPLVP